MHGEMWVPKIACHRPEAFRCLSGTAQMLNSLYDLRQPLVPLSLYGLPLVRLVSLPIPPSFKPYRMFTIQSISLLQYEEDPQSCWALQVMARHRKTEPIFKGNRLVGRAPFFKC